jgi:DNA-binding NarL/FixJ family response regulator
MLEHYVTLHTPDMILIDPNFGGWFDLTGFRETYNNLTNVKFVAIIANVIDNSHLKDYHEKIAIYDSVKEIADKLNGLMQTEEEQTQENDTEPLSQREKEIITYVVKGLTNKEIADKLCLSVHTVITHRRNIARKLQIHSPAGLTIYAIVNKLVELKT